MNDSIQRLAVTVEWLEPQGWDLVNFFDSSVPGAGGVSAVLRRR